MKPRLPQLQTTSNYKRFSFHRHQQPISQKHVSAIADSMKQFGFIASKPIQCIKNGSGLIIVDGHHRFMAAKALGIPIVFAVEESCVDSAIGPENFLVRKWSIASFASLYAAEGNQEYKKLLSYAERGLPIGIAGSMLIGHLASSSNVQESIVKGTFQVRTTKHADIVVGMMERLRGLCPAVSSRAFVDALSRCLFVRGFDNEMLEHRIKTAPTMIQPTARAELMLEQLEGVYNYRAKEKIPLAHLAREAAKQRNLRGLRNQKHE